MGTEGILDIWNYVLILLGIGLVIGGPIIIFKTIKGFLKHPKPIPFHQIMSQALNIVIGVLFCFAGILFVINNLKGNPLA